METPSSTKRVTRSQTLLALRNNNNSIPISKKVEDSASKSKAKINQDRLALLDITNDSPIVGLAKDCNLETPSSAITKQRSNRVKNTPGSGEALLRGQVKTLLQKVEEEAEISKISLENRPFLHLQGFLASSTGLVAPTPANAPQLTNFNEPDNFVSFTPLPVIEEQLKICQVVSEVFEGKKEESSTLESQKSLTRSLLLDFSEKSDSSSECYSISGETCKDDDSASNWSIQVNASVHDDDEEGYCHPDEEDYDYEYEYEGTELVAELCEKIGNICVSEAAAAAGGGKHTRFLYNSDDEIVEEEQVLHLKGLPTPTGKHLRFPLQDAAED